MRHHHAINIRVARLRLGLTQADMAHLLDTSQPRVSRIESGEYRPTIREVCKLCIILDMPLTELYGHTAEGAVQQLEQRLPSIPDAPAIWRSRKRRLDTLASLRFRLQAAKSPRT